MSTADLAKYFISNQNHQDMINLTEICSGGHFSLAEGGQVWIALKPNQAIYNLTETGIVLTSGILPKLRNIFLEETACLEKER